MSRCLGGVPRTSSPRPPCLRSGGRSLSMVSGRELGTNTSEMLLTDDARFVGLALAGSLLVRSTTGGAPWLAGRSRDPPPGSSRICDPMSSETKYRGLFSSLSASSTCASGLYRIPLSGLLEDRLVEYGISVGFQVSISQNSTFWRRLYRIPISRLLEYMFVEYIEFLPGWNFYFPELPILEPFVQDPNKGASRISACGL